MGRFERTWEDDWQERIYRRVFARDFGSLTAFAASRPRDTLIDLAETLGKDDVAPVQIETLLRDEAEHSKQVKAFAQSLLVRYFREELVHGWGNDIVADDGQRLEFLSVAAGASSAWTLGLPDRDQDTTDIIWERLKQLPIPTGWLPEGPDDPYIVKAFEGLVFPSDADSP